MRIIGIDPGSRKTGYGIIERNGNRFEVISYGVISSKDAKKIPDRLKIIFNELLTVIDNFKPQISAIEQVFMHINPDSAIKLGQARGAAISALTYRNLIVREYTANQIKNSVVGKGHASKAQIQFMIKHLLNIKQQIAEDAADGLACALCHSYHQGTADLKSKNLLRKTKKRSNDWLS